MSLRKLFLLTFVSGIVLADQCFDISNEDKIFINSIINKIRKKDLDEIQNEANEIFSKMITLKKTTQTE